MIVGIFSDTHLGFDSGDDRTKESFDRFHETMEFFIEKKVDVIIHAGDMFDNAVPTQETWLKTFEAFSKNKKNNIETKNSEQNENLFSKIKRVSLHGEEILSFQGIPFIAIHGTHEFRGKDFANAIDVLESAGHLIHIHGAYAEIEKQKENNKGNENTEIEKIYIHGLGGVPEKHAKTVLGNYNPQPVKGHYNLLMLHQSFKEYLPFDDDATATLSLADLPNGFDLIIDGHLHWTAEENIEGKKFLLTGSTIFTQMKQLESKKEKGCFLLDTETKKIDFVPFKEQRPLFYKKISFENALPENVMLQANEFIKECSEKKTKIKPLVRLKLVGTLAKGFTQADIVINKSDNIILSVSKELESEQFAKRIEELKSENKKDVKALGMDLLEKKTKDAGIEVETTRLFELLSIGENEKAIEVMLEKNK
jgi:DNA repair exonuclease SbcCD nuclease subunit